MKPLVTGFFDEPSMLMTLPCCTVTARLQASGQSSGHAVSTTDAGPPRIGSGLLGTSVPEHWATMRVILVGGGFGGLDAARALANGPVQVTLLDRHNHH